MLCSRASSDVRPIMDLYFCYVFTRSILPAKAKCGKHFVLHLEHTLIIHAQNNMGTYEKIFIILYQGSSFKSYCFTRTSVSDVSIKFIAKHQNEWCPSIQGIQHQNKGAKLKKTKIFVWICTTLHILTSLIHSVIQTCIKSTLLKPVFSVFYSSFSRRGWRYQITFIHQDKVIHILLNAPSNMDHITCQLPRCGHLSKEIPYPTQKLSEIIFLNTTL